MSVVAAAVLVDFAGGLRGFPSVVVTAGLVSAIAVLGVSVALSVVIVVSHGSRGGRFAASESRGRCRVFGWRWGVCTMCVRGVSWER
jgi:hypothetical protein